MAGSSSAAVPFQWGNKQAGTDSSYESMCLDGIWYNLHDCVSCRSGLEKPYVGKLMRLFEGEEGIRKVRIRWFFRPEELPRPIFHDLAQENVADGLKELFIGVGRMKGVENENSVEAILGKVTVLCTATTWNGRNVVSLGANPAGAVDLEAADYFFARAYDVEKNQLVHMKHVKSEFLMQMLANNKAEWLQENGQQQS